MRLVLLLAAFVVVFGRLPAAAGTAELDAALALIRAKRYPEAQAALEKIVVSEPTNATAYHELGMLLKSRNDNTSFETAVKWLAKAAELEPNNAVYLGDFGGTSLQLAGRTNSISGATKGRDAMEKAVAIDPGYLDAREGLVQFYLRAPWPFGSTTKAETHLAEIRKRDPDRAAILSAGEKVKTKDYAGAFKLCDEVLARKADHYLALYNYGRTASISGQNLEHGLECLQHCLNIDPPSPASPTHSHVWHRIGNIEEQLKHPDEARHAYETALQLDSSNTAAAAALAKLK